MRPTTAHSGNSYRLSRNHVVRICQSDRYTYGQARIREQLPDQRNWIQSIPGNPGSRTSGSTGRWSRSLIARGYSMISRVE